MATTPVFLPGKSHGQGSLAGYSPWGRKESDTTKHTHSILDKYNLSGSLFVDWFPMFSASLVAQLVKNPPVILETWVRSLGWEDPLEEGKLPTPVFLPGEFHRLVCIVRGVAKSRTRQSDFHFTSQ